MEIHDIKLSKAQASILFNKGATHYKKLKANNVALYSSTPYKQAKLTADLIKSLYPNNIKQQVILDANSNIGGNFMELANLGSEIHGVELDPIQFKALVNNVEVLIKRRTKLYLANTNVIKYLKDHNIFTIGFFDPPWREEFKIATQKNKLIKRELTTSEYKKKENKIPLYYDYKSKRYHMSDVVNMSNFETILFKVPAIYDSSELNNIKAKYHKYTYSVKETRGTSYRILYNLILLTRLTNKPNGDPINLFRASIYDDLRFVDQHKPSRNAR